MSKTSYICNCDVIHEDIVNDVKSKMQPKDDYIQLASLFKLFVFIQSSVILNISRFCLLCKRN